MSPHYLQTACKHRSRPTLIANKKIQPIPVETAAHNEHVYWLVELLHPDDNDYKEAFRLTK
jgi:hypothetical protein